MTKFSKFFLMLGALAILFSAFAVATAPASAAPGGKPKEVYMWHAQVSRARVMSTGPGAVTIRVMGSYTCDKARYNSYVSGKTIYIEVWDVKNRKSDCNKSARFTRDLAFEKLVPGTYTVLVNVHPDDGKAQRRLRNVVIPVYATPTQAPPAP